MKSSTVTISNGETTSETINLRDSNNKLVGLIFPTLAAQTTFTLKMSPDNSIFYSIVDASGAEIEFSLPAAGTGECYVPIPYQYTEGIDYFQIEMGTAVSADRVIRPITQRLMYP